LKPFGLVPSRRSVIIESQGVNEVVSEMQASEMLLLKDIYKAYTNLPMKKLNEILKHDLWFDSKTCLEYGLVDEII